MKKMIIVIAVLCCVALWANAMAQTSTTAPKVTVLKQDSGQNLSTSTNLSFYSAITDFGLTGLSVGTGVKFTAPKAGWKLRGVQVLGWSGYNNTTKLFPPDRDFLIEIRDKDLNLLYRTVDTQNVYFASSRAPVMSIIEIPALPVTGDFYIFFYGRDGMIIGMEPNGSGNSYLLIQGQLAPAEFKETNTNATMKVNWIIRAVGE